ncbi:MAG: P1 family peptidase, partial [Candidatus Aminicenantes bacterium]
SPVISLIVRTGGYYSGGSGDYAIAFSTAEGLRVPARSESRTMTIEILRNNQMSRLFLAAAEACEEAILNSMFKAQDMEGQEGRKIRALPLDKLKEILKLSSQKK